ncbi:heparan-alpha-glucosaminide N-acetyltransferase [Biomphalaria glabrata]|nr:heparan-alpha-glucosaminide N-acetyltransferase [Biomphalaria glabrata]
MTSGDDVSSLSYCVSQDDVTNSTETVVETTSLRDVSPSTSTSTSTSTTTTTTTTTSTTPVDDTPTQTTPDATTLGEILDTPEDSNDPISDYIKKYNEAVVYVGEEDDRPEDTPTKPELGIDQAWFTVNSTVDFVVEIWAQSDQCYKCDLMLITKIEANSVSSFAVNTTSGTDLRLVRVHPAGHPEQLCGFKSTFLESGDYWVFLGFPPPDEEMTCKVILANDPDISELPILFVLVGFLVLAIVYVIGKRLYSYFRRAASHRQDSMDVTSDHESGDHLRMGNGSGGKDVDVEDGTKPEKEPTKSKPRLKCLDTFRGLTLVLMIFVNYGGGQYWFFEHAPWNGILVADLVFPWFVFIMGVSMNFSFRSMFRQDWSAGRILWKIVWRAAKLFFIGFMLGTHYQPADLENVRILGVLQRLALTYLISALIHFTCSRRSDSHQDKKWSVIRDLILYIPEWLANLAILALHLGLVYGLPVPGCPTGYVGPGGLSEGGKYKNCTGGATQYIDSMLLGTHHMYQWPTPHVLYQTVVPFDPEGFLATLNCVFLCFLGIQCGRIILIFQSHKDRLIRFVAWAVFLGALGALFTKCSQDDGWIPANKNIWSLSYTLVTASFGFILLSALYVITDIISIWDGQPFIYPGMNSIAIYCCHGVFHNQFPVNWIVGNQHWKLLLRCVWGTSVWVIVAFWLYLKKIFIAL